MSPKIVAALFAAVALPVAAQTATPRVDAPAAPTARVEKAKATGPATPKERAKVAKAQEKKKKKAC